MVCVAAERVDGSAPNMTVEQDSGQVTNEKQALLVCVEQKEQDSAERLQTCGMQPVQASQGNKILEKVSGVGLSVSTGMFMYFQNSTSSFQVGLIVGTQLLTAYLKLPQELIGVRSEESSRSNPLDKQRCLDLY